MNFFKNLKFFFILGTKKQLNWIFSSSIFVPIFTYIHQNSCKTEFGSVPDFFPPIVVAIIKTALPNMDREAKEEYFVVIQAKDMGGHMGGLSGTTTVTITLTDVNDNPPKFAQSKCRYVCMFSYIRK